MKSGYKKGRNGNRMKKKGVLRFVIVLLAIFVLEGCGSSADSDNGKESSSQKSSSKARGGDFTSLIEEAVGKLDDTPEAKEIFLYLGNRFLEEGIDIEKAEYRHYDNSDIRQMKIYIREKEEKSRKETLEFCMKQIDDTWFIDSVNTWIWDREDSEKIAGIFLEKINLSQEEKDLVFNPEVADEILTPHYYLSHKTKETGTENEHWELTISYDEYNETPEMYTTLAQLRRKTAQNDAPTGDGIHVNIEEYGISFYMPEGMVANEYNGMLGVYDYYTGVYYGTRPTGVDLNLVATRVDDDMTAEIYAKTKSRAVNYEGVTELEEKELNGVTWWTGSAGTLTYYAAKNLGVVYEFYVTDGEKLGVTKEDVIELLEETVYLY